MEEATIVRTEYMKYRLNLRGYDLNRLFFVQLILSDKLTARSRCARQLIELRDDPIGTANCIQASPDAIFSPNRLRLISQFVAP